MEIRERNQKIIDLLGTIEEGLVHLQKQLGELRFEESFILYNDCVEGMNTVIANTEDRKYKSLEGLIMIAEATYLAYGGDQLKDLEGQVSTKLIPAFIEWKDEVEASLALVH